MRRLLLSLAVVTIFGAGFLVIRYPSVILDIFRGSPEPVSVVVAGAPDITMKDSASFRQDNDVWGADVLGQTSDSLERYGCTLTSVANAVSNVTGKAISPQMLNAKLGDVEGYTSRGWLIWSKVSEATDGAVRVAVHSAPSHDAIDACMRDGSYPIVKIKLGGVIPHWVMLVGRRNGEYLMRDPLLGTPEDGPLPLSVRANVIHSLRCLSAA